jgi:hypothetical protein
MFRMAIIICAAVVALTSIACGISVNLPVDRIVTGPTQTDQILVNAPQKQNVNLTLNFGAGNLQLQPASGPSDGALVTGTATYNVADFKPQIKTSGDTVRITTGELQLQGVPRLDEEVINRWDLTLGLTPMKLKLNAGAYQGVLELGGLALKSLDVTDGAANVQMRFSTPNVVEMDRLSYHTGASNVKLYGLANANFASMIFRSGAGNYTLDFSGSLRRDAAVTIESGFSQVNIVVPEGTTAKVITGGLLNVGASSSWKREGDAYVLGSGSPALTITVDLAAGSLALETK